jgi:hypothetical protein
MSGGSNKVKEKDENFDEWYGGEWCKICAMTIGMAKLGWCDWQKKLRTQGKECPKLLISEESNGKVDVIAALALLKDRWNKQ